MTALRTYRQIIAAVLLSLYAFITAPIQLWHHHAVAVESHKSADTTKHSISQNTDSAADANCSICSHKYSTYNDDVLHAFEPSYAATVTKNGYYLPFIIETISFSLSNKGPPAVC